MDKKRLTSNLLLVLTAFIWGTAFVAQSVGMDHIGPFTFNTVRTFIAALALLPVILVTEAMRKKRGEEAPEETPGGMKTLVAGGICCGLALFLASNLQQFAMQYTTVGKAGFITALYIILVPILGIFLKKKVHFAVWISAVIAVAGMYLLCIKEDFTIGKGDFIMFLCALGYTAHITVIDHFSPKVNCIKMSCIQFITSGVLTSVLMFILEKPTVAAIIPAMGSILYTGVMSSGVGYTLQIVAQKNTRPAIASLLMSLESVFAALSGWLFLNEQLTTKEFLGCALVFLGILLAQLPDLLESRRSLS